MDRTTFSRAAAWASTVVVLAGVTAVLVKAVRVSYGADAAGPTAIVGMELTAATKQLVQSDVFYISGSVGSLHPGAQSQLPLTVTNPMSVDITVTSLTVSSIGSDTIGCDGTSSQNLQVTGYSGPGFVVAHGGSAIVELPISMPASVADACQNATFALSYGGSGDAGSGWTKTITMGPSRMEGDLRISAGESIAAGYHLSARKPLRADGSVSVTNAAITLAVTCADGSTPPGSPITIALSNMIYTTPAGTTRWISSPDPASPCTYQGSVVAPDLCHGIGEASCETGPAPCSARRSRPSVGRSRSSSTTATLRPRARRTRTVRAPARTPSPASPGSAPAGGAARGCCR